VTFADDSETTSVPVAEIKKATIVF
jgi:hypothetical protein